MLFSTRMPTIWANSANLRDGLRRTQAQGFKLNLSMAVRRPSAVVQFVFSAAVSPRGFMPSKKVEAQIEFLRLSRQKA